VDAFHGLQDQFKDQLDILVVYILEAHAADEWPIPLGVGEKNDLLQTKNAEERIRYAKRFIEKFQFRIPIVVDADGDAMVKIGKGWPERWYIVEPNKPFLHVGHARPDLGFDIIGDVNDFMQKKQREDLESERKALEALESERKAQQIQEETRGSQETEEIQGSH